MNKLVSRLFSYSSVRVLDRSVISCNGTVSNNLANQFTTKMFKSTVTNLQEATADQVQEFLNSFDTVLTDCDGKTIFIISLSPI